MARLNKIAISLCALLFTSISLTPLAHASGHTHASATPKAHPAKGTTAERKKKQPVLKVKPPPKPQQENVDRQPQQINRVTPDCQRHKNAFCAKAIKTVRQLDKVDSGKQAGNRKRAEKVRGA